MIRNFVAGLAWGAVVSAAGLGVISQVAPPPGAKPAATAPEDMPQQVAAAEPAEAVAGPAAPIGPEPQPPAMPQVAPPPAADNSPTLGGTASAPAPASPAVPALTPPGAEAAPQVAPQAPATIGPVDAPAAPAQPAVSGTPATPAPETAPAPGAATPGAPGAEASETAPAPADLPPPAPGTAPDRLLEPAAEPAPAPAPASIAPQPVTEPEAEVPAASTLPADPGLAEAPGVTVGRLPAIGDAPEATPAPEAPAETDLPPIRRFAAAFENPAGKPLFALILMDDGSAALDRAQLAALPFPVTFVIDPLAATAAEAAATYRAAGHEVVMLASGIPAGAKASDIEQTFQSLGAALPQAVAAIDLAGGGFQDDRTRAAQVVPILKAQGRGLLTYERGLNAADQVARREDLPAALIFRQLDAEGEAGPVLRRYLDRAAFKAAQEGRVAVIGSTRPETVAAILEWTVEGRAASVTLAPVTAVLTVN